MSSIKRLDYSYALVPINTSSPKSKKNFNLALNIFQQNSEGLFMHTKETCKSILNGNKDRIEFENALRSLMHKIIRFV